MPVYLHAHSSSPASFVHICLFRFAAIYSMLGGSFGCKVGGIQPWGQPWLSSAANLWRQVPEGLRRTLQLCQPHRLHAHRQSPVAATLAACSEPRPTNKQTNKTNKQTNKQKNKPTNKHTCNKTSRTGTLSPSIQASSGCRACHRLQCFWASLVRVSRHRELLRASNAKPR